MGDIRKQSISSSVLIYFGFAFGALNTYLFTKQGFFEPSQFGLTQALVSFNQVLYSFACLGMVSVMSRFYPYYYDSLKKNENDLLTLAFVISMIGFVLVITGGFFFKPFFVQKFLTKSPGLVDYYFWLFPSTFFLLVFSILEAHSSIYKKTVFPNFLREGMVRICTTLLIILYGFKVISFDLFMKLFACNYGITALLLYVYLRRNTQVKLVFKISSVTRKKGKEIAQFISYVFLGIVIAALAQQIDSILILSRLGEAQLGIYTLSAYIATVVQVPQRGMAAIASPYMAQAWKDENYTEIQRIYFRSSINLLLISLFIFCNIWLNIDDAYKVFGINQAYQSGKYVILILSITKIIDMGTGVNSQLLYASPSWRFEFYSNALLLALTLPLSYYLVKQFGIIGAAYSNLISYSVFNAIRIFFIYKKYGMQPFNAKTIHTIAGSIAVCLTAYYLTQNLSGFTGMILRSVIFSGIFIALAYALNLSPDLKPLLELLKAKLKRR